MAIRFKGVFDSRKRASPSSPRHGEKSAPWRGVQLPIVPRTISRRYSRFVRAMKLVLPALALALIALVAFWPHLTSKDRSFRLGFTAIGLSSGEDPSMVNVRYVGTDRKDRPFTVTADLARNMDAKGAVVSLESPKADVLMQDGTWLLLSARTGIYKSNEKTLDLVQRVNLFHDSGYEFHTEQARIDLATSSAEGDKPIQGQGTFGEMTGSGFKISDQGRTLLFKGPARAVLHPGGKPAKKQDR